MAEPEPQSTLADVYADSLVVLSAPNERRTGARRRATHRRRRRTVLTMGLGLLVATAGTLAVARMATEGQRSDRAATVVLTDDGPQQPAPLPQASTPVRPHPPGPGRPPRPRRPPGPLRRRAGPGWAPRGSRSRDRRPPPPRPRHRDRPPVPPVRGAP
ncbi:hypothetical protein [Streptomyces sp. NBC_01546]|uniref:hypothetical protein n=1 Tax=Streptomyces sp. NBC_01546 TaxID=2975872 RepID=UPI00386E8663